MIRLSDCIFADWPAPESVVAVSTTRCGGRSVAPFDKLNLGLHVGDQAEHVLQNRKRLEHDLSLPQSPCWLDQVHGERVLELPPIKPSKLQADAAFTRQEGVVCAVLTADCLPVFFTDKEGRYVAVAHAGWRGLLAGVLLSTLARLPIPPGQVMVWLGPAIGPKHFAVGDEVRQSFVQCQQDYQQAFVSDGGKWLMDIWLLARVQLQRAGVSQIFGGGLCTVTDHERFFSFRRDGITGRMAHLIWINPRGSHG
jgi:polyphenol oxidase